MKRLILLILLILLCFTASHASEVIARIDDHFKDPFLLVDTEYYYIWDRVLRNVKIYPRKDVQKIASFGRFGQGPGEFTAISSVAVTKEYILVNSFPKLCYFSKEGKFIKELKCSNNAGTFIPLGSNFVGTYYPPSNPKGLQASIIYALYNSSLNREKILLNLGFRPYIRHNGVKEEVLFFRECLRTQAYNNKLYIPLADSNIKIAVFDEKGSRCTDIEFNLKKRKVTEKDKQRQINKMKSWMKKNEWQRYRQVRDIVFPEFYPAFESFSVANDGIYIFGFPYEEYRELIILDLNGNLRARKRFPLLNAVGCISQGRYAIENGFIYYVIDNDKTETWDLHALKICTLRDLLKTELVK